VGLESKAGVGSVFHVVLPLKLMEGTTDAAE